MQRFSYHVRYTRYSAKELYKKVFYDTNHDYYFASNFENNFL